MSLHAVTVLGHDRPGIIAQVTSALAGLGLNIEDSTMTLLRGHFAMTLISEGSAAQGQIESALAPLGDDGTLSVTVREVAEESPTGGGTAYLLRVHGGDRPGIVSALAGEVARAGGNIVDLSTMLTGDLYVLYAECTLPATADGAALGEAIAAVATGLGVHATLSPLDADDL